VRFAACTHDGSERKPLRRTLILKQIDNQILK
jgi:hypothetical protein